MLKYHKSSLPALGETVSQINFTANGQYANIKFSSGKVVGVSIQKDYTKEEIRMHITHYIKHHGPIKSNDLKKLMEPLDIPSEGWVSGLRFLVESDLVYLDEDSNLNPCRRRSRRSKK